MTSQNEEDREYEEKKTQVLGAMYELMKTIDDKIEEILDEIRDALEASRGDYYHSDFWDRNNSNGY